MDQYEAWYRTPNGGLIKVYVQADGWLTAKMLLEGQYGAANIWGVSKV